MLLILFILLLTFLILTQSATSLHYAMNGFTLWYAKMVPGLLPFMILSGVLIRTGNSQKLAKLISLIIHPFFHCNQNIYYGILTGFLCGFPMGAKTAVDMLKYNLISTREATYLLAFCNNIGPVYYCSFVLPLLHITNATPYLIGMYGIPFLYGILLRHFKFHDISRESLKKVLSTPNPSTLKTTFAEALNDSIYSALQSIIMLCGYMILFNVFMLIPHYLIPGYKQFIWPILEITGGLSGAGNLNPIYSLTMICFGGLCCLMQTNSIIKQENLSLRSYFLHKLILALLSMLYFIAIYNI